MRKTVILILYFISLCLSIFAIHIFFGSKKVDQNKYVKDENVINNEDDEDDNELDELDNDNELDNDDNELDNDDNELDNEVDYEDDNDDNELDDEDDNEVDDEDEKSDNKKEESDDEYDINSTQNIIKEYKKLLSEQTNMINSLVDGIMNCEKLRKKIIDKMTFTTESETDIDVQKRLKNYNILYKEQLETINILCRLKKEFDGFRMDSLTKFMQMVDNKND